MHRRMLLIGSCALIGSGCGKVGLHLTPEEYARAGPLEKYAVSTGRLAPQAVTILQPFFTPLHFDVGKIVRVEVLGDWFGSFGIRGTPVAAGVLGNTIYCIPGVLDADGSVRSNVWSWTQPRGIARWAHEVYHVYQWQQKEHYFAKLVPGLLESWKKGQLYSHQEIPLEQDAMAFQQQVLHTLQGQL